MNVAIRCLTVVDSLWRFPPRLGGWRTTLPQLKMSSQLVTESGLETTLRSSEARCVAQDGRADLGICLINEISVGDHMAEDRLSCSVFTSAEDDWKGVLTEELEAGRGGLLDPGHGSCRGPCLWMVPSRRCNCRVAKQILHVPLDLLTNWERGQFWDISNARPVQRTCHAE